MRLLDTVVLVGALSPTDRLHEVASRHLATLETRRDTLVPASTLLEFDLIMRTRNYTPNEVGETWGALGEVTSERNILANMPSALGKAVELRERGLDYFDSLITALALSTKSVVVTNDRAIRKFVQTDW